MNNASWIDRKEYPFESRFFEVSAGRLHYVDEGEGDPIVMVHGNPTWSFLYRDLIRQLKPNYRWALQTYLMQNPDAGDIVKG